MRQASRLLVSVAAFFIFIAFSAGTLLGQTDVKDVEKELTEAARGAVASGQWDGFNDEVEKRIASVLGKDGGDIRQKEMVPTIFYFSRVGQYFPQCNVDEAKKFLNWLLDHRALCWRFLNAIDANDDPERAFVVLKDLFDMGEARFLEFGELAIAYAVAWDNFEPHYLVGTNDMPEDWYKETYKFYTVNNKRMFYDLRRVPWEISQYVIASAISAAERKWVLKRYNKNLSLKNCYFSVKYDYDAVRGDRVKKMDGKPYNLMNLNRFGGVCSDRSYYAANVARVFGIPSMYIAGTGQRGNHAWVGFLQVRGKAVDWNVRVGRFSYDHYYQGSLTDYTSSGSITDGELMMTAALFKAASTRKRNMAVAFRDSAMWAYANVLGGNALEGGGGVQWGAFEKDKPEEKPDKSKEASVVFSLLTESLRLSPYDKETWLFLAEVGRQGYLSSQQMENSFALLRELTLRRYPDFSFTIFEALAAGIDDVKRRDSLYTKGFQLFKPRPDFAANVKLLQGEMWEEAGNNNSAGRAYLEALLMFKTESHVVTSAFRHVDDLYEKTNRPRDALRTYSRIWPTLKRPTSNFGFKSSLYKLMGDRLAELLADAGNLREAGKIKRQIEQAERSLSW